VSSILILLGPPGAGKGTQAERLSREFSLPHVSTGDLFRENKAQQTELGKRAQEFMDAGRLVPDEVVIDMLFDRVSAPDCAAGFLLDGFPRTIPQAEALGARLPAEATVRALALDVPDAALITRLTGRVTCRKCGNIHHSEFSPPSAVGVCDACGGELYQRADDSPEVVTKRLAVYREQTEPLIEYYTRQGVLSQVNGNRSPDEVGQALVAAARGETV